MSGPFDDLTEAQRMQIREAHIAEKQRKAREGFWTAGGWTRLEDAPPEPDDEDAQVGCPDHPEGVQG